MTFCSHHEHHYYYYSNKIAIPKWNWKERKNKGKKSLTTSDSSEAPHMVCIEFT